MLSRLKAGSLVLLAVVSVFFFSKENAYAQVTDQGTIAVTVTDPSKALLPDTHVKLIDKGTNNTREGVTTRTGVYLFQGLAPAEYRLIVVHDGFQEKTYETVVVQAGITTPVNAVMTIGSEKQQVDVSAVSVPVIETSSNTLSTSVDLNEVQNLPVQGRSLLSLQTLSPGYSSSTGTGTGTFNGMAQASYSAGVDGVNSTNLRNDSGNGTSSSITLRTENIQEFTVQTGELDASQGGGRSASQSLFTTNRGTNKFHGALFEDFQNAALNANTWASGVTKQAKGHLILNDFGGSVGGPVLKNKLFFFGNYSMNISPSTLTGSAVVPTPAAFAGNYTYAKACPGSTTATAVTNCPVSLNTVNVLQYAQNGGQVSTINPAVQLNHDLIATTYTAPGVTFTQSTTQYNTLTENWLTPVKATHYYPAARLDYALTSKINWSLSGNMSKSVTAGQYPGYYPGSYFQQKYTGTAGNSYVLSTGLDWTITPRILNQFKVGYLYTNSFYSPEALSYNLLNQGTQTQGFGLSNTNIAYTGIGQFYPYISFSDDVSWQKGAHTIKFGGNGWRQQDHYYNGRLGMINISVGMSSTNDPAYNPIVSQTPGYANSTTSFNPNTPSNLPGAESDIASLYGYLNGRITNIASQYSLNQAHTAYAPGAYNLDELARGGGIYLMDSWRAFPGLTLNYGLRWDFIGDQHDLKNGYTGPDSVSLFGSSGYMNYFQPGANSGPAVPTFYAKSHAYHANLVLPQPQVGLAWNPSGSSDSWLGRIFGQGKSVVRASFTIKNYTEGGQNFWNNASNQGFNFINNGNVGASITTGPQYFGYGQYHLQAPAGYTAGGDPIKACPDPISSCVATATDGSLPPMSFTPSVYSTSYTESSLFFGATGNLAINPYIKEPYTESWTLGFQRQLTHSSAIEVRYVGNHTVHDWLNINYGEANGIESGFLQDFKNAQQNLAINAAAGSANDFSNHGAGPAMPIITAAFAGNNVSNFKSSTYVNYLKYGAMGSFVASIANNETFFCNVVGQGFGPCATAKIGPATSAYPANLFEVNPYLESKGANYLDSVGSSNYNGLQVEFRQKVSHGWDFNGNYTYAKSLGFDQQGSTSSTPGTFFTLHNRRLNYVPSAYDIRNTFKMSSTYALPFGKGKAFLNRNKLENYTVGGWTVGGIFVYQSGAPSLLTGGLSSTVNSAADGGVTFLPGHSAREIQSQIHITRAAAGNAYVNFVPSTLQGVTAANSAILVPNTTPGVVGNLNYLYGPKWNNLSMSLTKDFPVFERVHMNLQGEFLNLPNHPAWGLGNTTVNSATFGTTGGLLRGSRVIELRANITF